MTELTSWQKSGIFMDSVKLIDNSIATEPIQEAQSLA